MKRILGVSGAVLQCVFVTVAAPVPELPVETFFHAPLVRQLALSPDGRCFGAIASQQGVSSLIITDLETGTHRTAASLFVQWFAWVSDDRLLIQTTTGLVAVNRDGSAPALLVPLSQVRSYARDMRAQHVRLLSTRSSDPNCILVEKFEFNPKVGPRFLHPHVERLNHLSGETVRLEKNPGDVVRWFTDAEGEVRAAVAVKKDRYRLLFRSDSEQPWTTALEGILTDNETIPLGFAPDGKSLYVAAHNGADTLGIYLYDPATHALGDRLWQHPEFDLLAPLTYGIRPALAGVLYEGERPRVEWLDETAKAGQSRMDQALPETVNLPVSSTRDGSKFVYYAFSDRTPGRYYLADMKRGQFGVLADGASWVKPEQMAEMKPITYRARDGLTIRGYLTLPVGSLATNLPMIMVPHGGPWVRDSWGFDPDVQFFANRGYAVLQVNFRGSTGYGQTFYRAGFKQFGRKMQDDITDGVQWAIDQGIADPNRLAIYGMSYGGYAALMGLIATPHLYRCGISYAGVTDLPAAVKQSVIGAPKPFAAIQYERVGHLRSDEDELDAVSPVKLADQIQVPVLLAYGEVDPIVDVDQGKQLAKILKKRKKQVELIVEPLEGHGFMLETNRLKLFRKIESFLKDNLRP